MPRPLKVLFLMEDLCFGGTQKQTLALAARLDRQIFAPAMLTLTGPTDLDDTAKEADVPVFHMGSSRKAAPFFFARLGAALARQKPDILVPCTALPNIWGRIWGMALGVPAVIGTSRGGGAPARQHERFLWRFARHIVCNSPALKDRLLAIGVPATHVTFIPNGVDVDYFRPAPDIDGRSQVILCAARLAADKDHITLLRAFAIIARDFPSASLRFVGEGPEEKNIRRFAAENLEPDILARVEFAGASQDMRPHYANAGIFALSSIREGQPNVILEAMSSGLPVCATNVGGIPSLVEENKSGLLCGAGDAPAMARNIASFLANPEMGAKFGRAGRKIAEKNFSFETMTRAHQNIFMQAWSRWAPRKPETRIN